MLHLSGEMNVGYDVDETLILHKDSDTAIDITNPYTGETKRFTPHSRHVTLLKDHKARGYRIIVWSNGGDAWAKAVVDALGLGDEGSKSVDIVMTKLCKYVDDLPAEQVLANRIYLTPENT